MASEEVLRHFIASSFRSVWALEALCSLRQSKDGLSPQELVVALRASDAVSRQCIAELTAAGLVVVADDGRVSYAPATPDLDALASSAEARYASAPNAVRRIIVRSANEGLSAFADAFRLKDKP